MIRTDGRPTVANAPTLHGFHVTCEGSIYLIQPLDAHAQLWLRDNVGLDEAQFFGGALVVEHRYIVDLLDGIFDAGFEVH